MISRENLNVVPGGGFSAGVRPGLAVGRSFHLPAHASSSTLLPGAVVSGLARSVPQVQPCTHHAGPSNLTSWPAPNKSQPCRSTGLSPLFAAFFRGLTIGRVGVPDHSGDGAARVACPLICSSPSSKCCCNGLNASTTPTLPNSCVQDGRWLRDSRLRGRCMGLPCRSAKPTGPWSALPMGSERIASGRVSAVGAGRAGCGGDLRCRRDQP